MATDAFPSDGFTTTTGQIAGAGWGRSPDVVRQEGARVDMPVDSQLLVDSRGTRFVEESHPAFPKPKPKQRHLLRWLVMVAIAALVTWASVRYGLPMVREALETESTDDAFVTSHVTNTSARIDDLVTEVAVEKNQRVEPGMLLVRLDRVPFELAVAQGEAALQQARAQLDMARTQARGQLALARANWFRRKNAQEQIRRQVASLRAQVATLHARESSEKLADVEQRRINNLAQRGSATQSELDQRNNTLEVARQQVKETWADIQETRAALGLAANYDNPLDVPKELEREQSNVQSAVSEIASTLAQLGVPFDVHSLSASEAFEQILKLDTSDNLEKALGDVIEAAPAIRVAKAAVVRAERQLDDARIRLGYTEIRSEIAGYIEDRSVNPGNRVQPGQTLLSIRPDYVWIEANYKETQLHKIAIGMPVELRVDAYPGRRFKGRVAGFSPSTGLASSLLPPENATGNYVKVTQRLPVRIELTEPAPRETPLFVGLSVEPYVHFKEEQTGPDAGRRLIDLAHPAPPSVGGGPAGSLPQNRDEPRRPAAP